MKITVTNKRIFPALLIFCLAYAGCRISKPAALPAMNMPTVFHDSLSRDTATMADLSWKEVFTDPLLVSLIDSTLTENLDLKRAIQRISILRSQYQIARRAREPQVNAQIGAGGERYGDYTMNGVGNFDTNLSGNINRKQRIPTSVTPDFFVGLRSSWEVDLWGRLKNLKKAALARYLASEEAARLIQTSLVAEVANRYYQLTALENELAIIRNNIRLQDSALQIVQYLKHTARANELAVQQFSAQLLNTRALESGTLQQMLEVQNELHFLRGSFNQGTSFTTGGSFQPLPEALQTGLPAQLLFRRPDIREAEQSLAATRADVAAARAAFYPALSLTPAIGLNSFRLSELFSASSIVFGVVGNAIAPVINQGQLTRGLQIADATRLDAYYNYRQVVLNGFREVTGALGRISNMTNVYDLKEAEVQVLKDAVNTSNILFKTGYASYLEVITAQRSVLDAELQLVQTRENRYRAYIDLYQALGGGWK